MDSRPKSVIEGRDGDVLDLLFSFYTKPEGRVVDLTANNRKMWKGLDSSGVVFCDIDEEVKPDVVCCYTKTPFESDSCSVLVFDPPHLPKAAASDKSLQPFVKNYGLDKSVDAEGIEQIFPAVLKEASRILKPEGLLFAKLIDFVHNHKYQWTLQKFVNAVEQESSLTACDLVIKRDPSAGSLKSGRWQKAHHLRRAHCWWVVVRKGRCETRLKSSWETTVGRKLSGGIEMEDSVEP